MATSRPFAFNTGTTLQNCEQIGSLAILTGTTLPPEHPNTVRFWNGPDEDLGYVIAFPVSGGTAPNPVGIQAYLNFLRTVGKSTQEFINLANWFTNYTQNFTSATAAKTWLNQNGYWTSYDVPSLTITELFTTTGEGTWTKPEGVTEVTVECWGGGGGGGSAAVNDSGGGGGGGGGYARSTLTYPSAQQSIPYTVGSGGIEAAGGDSTWDSGIVAARGGQPGEPALGPDQTAFGGTGGGFVPEISVLLPNIGNVTYTGGNGSDGWALNVITQAIAYSAGGGGAGSTNSGGNANPNSDPPLGGLGASEFGGNGGNGTLSSSNFTGLPGNNYGGGGSGAQKISGSVRLGGNGAQGLIRITYSTTPPLDTFTGSSVAVSVRRLSSSAVYCMKVRRSNDNATLDIGFNDNGLIDTDALLAFVGAATGYVDTWYDQSGNGNNLDIGGFSIDRQPIIVSSGNLILENGKPSVSFTSSTNFLIKSFIGGNGNITNSSGLWFTFGVGKVNDATTRVFAHTDNNTTYRIAQNIRRGTTALETIGFNTANTAGTDNNGVSPGTNQFIAYSQRTATNVEIYMNGSSNGATAIAGSPQTVPAGQPVAVTIGIYNPATLTFPWLGTMQELIHFPQDPATFNYRVNLTNEINLYYGTY